MKTPIVLIAAFLLASCALAADASPAPIFQMRLIAKESGPDSQQMTLVSKNADITVTNIFNVEKTALLDQTALKSANVITDSRGKAVIEITFTKAGAGQFAVVTRENIGRQLGIIINGDLCSTPLIRTAIEAGKANIAGSFSEREAQDLAKKINAAITK